MMVFFALLVAVVLLGIALQTITSFDRTGGFELSRFWYLALGLMLVLPTIEYPLAMMRKFRNPNPTVRTFNLPLTLACELGLILVIRSAIRKPRWTRVGNIAP